MDLKLAAGVLLVIAQWLPIAPVLPARDTNPYAARIAQLEQQLADRDKQLVDRQNEVIHQRADLANCKATVDSLELTTEVTDLVRRYEAAYGGSWTWDDKARRVVKLLKEKP
jgi:multidrug resistance efflux pump